MNQCACLTPQQLAVLCVLSYFFVYHTTLRPPDHSRPKVSSTVSLPLILFGFVVYLNACYWPLGLPAEWFKYTVFATTNLVATLMGYSMAQTLSAAMDTPQVQQRQCRGVFFRSFFVSFGRGNRRKLPRSFEGAREGAAQNPDEFHSVVARHLLLSWVKSWPARRLSVSARCAIQIQITLFLSFFWAFFLHTPWRVPSK